MFTSQPTHCSGCKITYISRYTSSHNEFNSICFPYNYYFIYFFKIEKIIKIKKGPTLLFNFIVKLTLIFWIRPKGLSLKIIYCLSYIAYNKTVMEIKQEFDDVDSGTWSWMTNLIRKFNKACNSLICIYIAWPVSTSGGMLSSDYYTQLSDVQDNIINKHLIHVQVGYTLLTRLKSQHRCITESSALLVTLLRRSCSY